MEKQKTRNEIEEQYKWDLSCLYSSVEEIENDKKRFLKLVDELVKFKGKITSSADSLYNYLKLDSEIIEMIDNLGVYAYCLKTVDVNNQEGQKLYNEIVGLEALYNEKCCFAMPELMKTDYSIIKGYISSDSRLKEYEFNLEYMYRYQKYTLSDSEEKLLSYLGEIRGKTESNFEMLDSSIMKFGSIKDENGNEVELTNGNCLKYLRSKSRDVRRSAYETRGKVLKEFAKVMAIDYESAVRTDVMVAKTRGYDSDIDMHLYGDGVTPEVYDNLLSVAKKNINSLYKYYNMIKKVSKIDDLEVYDMLVPLTEFSTKKYTPEDARKIILNALQVYGDEYVSVLKEAFDNRWIDYYPNEGKIAGCYKISARKGHPFVFANYNDDFDSVSAICHELGHAMHSYFSDKCNPSHLASYKIIVAEVASLTNEILLSNYIVKNSNDKQEKLAALENVLDVFSNNFFGTLSQGSIFEREVHKRMFNGDILTESDFNDIYDSANALYYGDVVKKHEFSKYNWARIPHFYRSFYYYKYSIGAACACYIAKKILDGDKEFLNKYLKFLSLGGSMMPLDELKTLGIDLTKTDAIEDSIRYFDSLIDEFEIIYNS